MTNRTNFSALIQEHKTAFIVIAVALFLIELEIFAIFAMKSGQENRLQILDEKGNLIYETDGGNLSDFNKYYFEKTFGSLEQFQKKLVRSDKPFKYRAWFVSAIAVPIGGILLFSFAVLSYMSLFYRDEKNPGKNDGKTDDKTYGTRLEKIIGGISKFNVFIIGTLAFLSVVAVWFVPNMIEYVLKAGIDNLVKFKWFFITAGLLIFGVLVWIIYLKFLLAKKAIDSQVEIDKYRMKLEFHQGINNNLQLAYKDDKDINGLVAWDTNEDNEQKVD